MKHDVIAFVSSVAEKRRRRGPLPPSGPDLERRRRHRLRDAAARRGRSAAARASTACAPPCATQAERHKHTPMIGRTHGIHAEPITFGLKCAELVRGARARPPRARRGARADRVRQALGRGRHVREQPARGRGRRAAAGSGSRRSRIATQVVPRDRHAHFFTRAGGAGRHLRAHRDRDPPPAAHRGRRGAGAVRTRPEGLLGDAAQAQPDPGREPLRARAPGAELRAARRSRTWRSGTSATSATRRSSA